VKWFGFVYLLQQRACQKGRELLTPLNHKAILKNGVIEDFFLAVGKEKMDTLYPSSDIQMDIKYPAF
jgi:hypothetical protein